MQADPALATGGAMPHRLALMMASLAPFKVTFGSAAVGLSLNFWALADPDNPLPYWGIVATVIAALSPWAKVWRDDQERKRERDAERDRQEREDRLEHERLARHDRLEAERLEREAKLKRHDIANRLNEALLRIKDLEERLVENEAQIAAGKPPPDPGQETL